MNRRGLFKGLAALLGCAVAAPFVKLSSSTSLPLLAASHEAFEEYKTCAYVDSLTVKLSNLGPLAEGRIRELMGLGVSNG